MAATGPMALVAYGSLMHPDVLVGLAEAPGDGTAQVAGVVPVRVRGFRRSFCQEPSWRDGAAERRGVLTVRPSDDDWINAILICDCDADTLARLDHRERGYSRRRVPPSLIEPYAVGGAPGLGDASAAGALSAAGASVGVTLNAVGATAGGQLNAMGARTGVTLNAVGATAGDATGRIDIYAGRDELRNDELLPNPDYLELCIDAARCWGADFARDFLATTFVGRTPLRKP